MFSRAMSSGVLTVKNRKKVRQVHAQQDQHAVGDAADDVASIGVALCRQASTSPRAFVRSRRRRLAPAHASSASSASAAAAPSATTPAGSIRPQAHALGHVQAQVLAMVADQHRRLVVVHPGWARAEA